jgi:hypothetical protein
MTSKQNNGKNKKKTSRTIIIIMRRISIRRTRWQTTIFRRTRSTRRANRTIILMMTTRIRRTIRTRKTSRTRNIRIISAPFTNDEPWGAMREGAIRSHKNQRTKDKKNN